MGLGVAPNFWKCSYWISVFPVVALLSAHICVNCIPGLGDLDSPSFSALLQVFIMSTQVDIDTEERIISAVIAICCYALLQRVNGSSGDYCDDTGDESEESCEMSDRITEYPMYVHSSLAFLGAFANCILPPQHQAGQASRCRQAHAYLR